MPWREQQLTYFPFRGEIVLYKLQVTYQSCRKPRKIKPNPRTERNHTEAGHKGTTRKGAAAQSCRYCLHIWDWPPEENFG